MSWGERSCLLFYQPGCPIPSNERHHGNCDVNCPGYKFDGIHKPDSQFSPAESARRRGARRVTPEWLSELYRRDKQ